MVYIIIVNYKCWNDTFECLVSLLDSSHQDWQAFIVDNDSNDDSLKKIQASLLELDKAIDQELSLVDENAEINDIQSKIVLLQSYENRGFAGANNLVLSQLLLKEGTVWLLNPDVIVQKNTLENLYNCAQSKDESVIWGMILKSYSNRSEVLFKGGGKVLPFFGTVQMITEFEDEKTLGYINGSSLFASLSVFKRVGLFNEKYFLYWEETDWCYRAKKNGIQYGVCSQAIGYDKGATSIGRGFLSDYYYGRNSLLFLKDHYTIFHVISSIGFSFLRIIIRILRGRRDRANGLLQGVLDYLKGRDGKRE